MEKTVNRPWGNYVVILDEDYCKVKKITVNPDEILSLQYHLKRDEFWVVVSGFGVVIKGDDSIDVNYGDTIFIPRSVKHRIHNTGDQPLIFIETQLGDYFGEDDIIRIEDKYNRKINE